MVESFSFLGDTCNILINCTGQAVNGIINLVGVLIGSGLDLGEILPEPLEITEA